MDWKLSPDENYSCNTLKDSKSTLSFHRKWLGYGSTDGQLELRLLRKPVRADSMYIKFIKLLY